MTCSIEPSLMSIGALLLIVADYREMGMFGLEHPVFAVSASAAYAFRDNVPGSPTTQLATMSVVFTGQVIQDQRSVLMNINQARSSVMELPLKDLSQPKCIYRGLYSPF
jgi:hypothetical protein